MAGEVSGFRRRWYTRQIYSLMFTFFVGINRQSSSCHEYLWDLQGRSNLCCLFYQLASSSHLGWRTGCCSYSPARDKKASIIILEVRRVFKSRKLWSVWLGKRHIKQTVKSLGLKRNQFDSNRNAGLCRIWQKYQNAFLTKWAYN